jgi:hypothetical protein
LTHLRRELALRDYLNTTYSAHEPQADGWPGFAHEGNRRGRARAERALGYVSEELDWAFDTAGVVGHSMRISHLTRLTGALGQALRGLGRDELLYTPGSLVKGVTVPELIDPYVASLFPSSFGLHVIGPPVDEQMLIFTEGSVFERAVERLLNIFGAAAADDPENDRLPAELTGLRGPTLNGIKWLAEIIAEGDPSVVRWRGEPRLVIAPPDAVRVAAAISEADPVEIEITVLGELREADLDGGFRVVRTSPTGQAEPYSGGVEPETRESLKSITLGSYVRATIKVTQFDAPFRDAPREVYVLSGIEVAG